MTYFLGYIDENKAEVRAFKRFAKDEFKVIAYNLGNSTTPESLFEQVIESEVDALVVDFLLVEDGKMNFNGEEIVHLFKERLPHFPVIVFTSHEGDAIASVNYVNLIYEKDILGKPAEKRDNFKKRIILNIENYRKQVYENETLIQELVEKRNNEGLNSREEQELLSAYRFIEETYPSKDLIPDHLINQSSLGQLGEFVDRANEILTELRKKDDSSQK